MAKPLEFLRTGDEIRFAIDFQQNADFSPGMDVRAHEAVCGFALGFFLRRGLPFLRRYSTAFSMSPADSTNA